MMPHRKLRAVASRLILAPTLGLVLLTQCARDPESALVSVVPGLDRDVARHLVSDDDDTLVGFARAVGIYPFWDAGSLIVANLQSESAGEFERSREKLLPPLRRIAAVFETEFESGYYRNEVAFWSKATGDAAVETRKARLELTSTLLDTTLSTVSKIEYLQDLLADYEAIGYAPGVIQCKHEIGNLFAEVDKSEQLRYYRSALAAAEAAESFLIVCQILGTLGHEAAVAGHTDSMFYFWDRSREVAERHKVPDYAARIYAFYAQHYRTEGRLALSHDLLQEAQTVCQELKGGYRELRFLVKLIEFYNELGCWHISGRLLQRAAVLEKQVPENLPGGPYSFKLRALLANARYLMAQGQVDDAEQILNQIKPFVRQQLHRDQYPRLLFQWSKDLLKSGRSGQAVPLIDEGLAWCESVNFPYLIPMFHTLRAELEFGRGDMPAALAALRSFESTTERFPAKYEREWLTRDVIRTRVFLARGNADSAVTWLEEAFSRLERYLEKRDASTHGYLWLGQCSDLRDLLHEFTRGDAIAAYGAELYWRELYQRLGGRSTPAAGGGLTARILSLATGAMENLRRTGRVHCLYRVMPDHVIRITATADGVRQDKLSTPVGDLSRLVAGAWASMADESAAPDAAIPGSLVTHLRALALQLLPPEVLESTIDTPRLLLITPDGFLASLPFETFNLAPDGTYRPLLADWEVAYLRRAQSLRPARSASTELLVANPALSPSARRRLSASQPLPEASKEAADMATLLDNPTVLTGVDATKSSLTGHWENASLVYVAAHFLANPEVPYLTTLPLADPQSGAAPDAALLDIGDVRAADLGGCRMAVLSGCATGAPYSSGEAVGPGFGDAFLDAGAEAVVQTFWAVRDDVAREQMSLFMRAWRSSGRSSSRALNDVRRSLLETDAGYRHPHHWATFAVKMGSL